MPGRIESARIKILGPSEKVVIFDGDRLYTCNPNPKNAEEILIEDYSADGVFHGGTLFTRREIRNLTIQSGHRIMVVHDGRLSSIEGDDVDGFTLNDEGTRFNFRTDGTQFCSIGGFLARATIEW